MTIVKVATTNAVKLEAIESAFRQYFDEIKIIAEKVESGVAEQPTNDLIFQGAENRLDLLKKENYDFLVACEGGLLNQMGYWFNIQAVLIEDKNGKRGMGMSQGYEIPRQYIQAAINTSIAAVLDDVFEGRGGIRELTRGYCRRGDLIKDATIMALTRVLNGSKW